MTANQPISPTQSTSKALSNLHTAEDDLIKKRIRASIRELDRTDYIDICSLIKTHIPIADNVVVIISARGTHIELDYLDPQLLRQMDNMIMTKLQRIHLDQS